MSVTTHLLLFILIFAFCLSPNGVYAFGAGNIPSFAYMEGRAFRHGDIEDTLSELIKGGGGIAALASMISGGRKFNGLDVKRVYFGNWLRDYSQAIDIASLKKMPIQTIMNLLMVLGFMAHGYATHEFEVTQERIGVYLPVEHIDNPKGYGEGEDARKYHPALRPPVDPRELEIDPRTGMKNYIANEQGTWDTSKALVRRLIERCVHLGRQHRTQGRKQDEYEAYRILGTLLHTLEDFTAHSNWCEIALVTLGHRDVFLHVGDQVRIQAPNGQWVAPIVTGTFGSNDFFHSLLGEAGDHLSQASVTDLNKSLDSARARSSGTSTSRSPMDPAAVLRDLFFSIPGGGGGELSREMEAVERIRAVGQGQGGWPGQQQAQGQGGGKRPEEMSPQELHSVLWQVLTFRDSVMKKIEKTIEKIPGLNSLIEKITDSISVFVFTTLEPFLKPILKTSTSALSEISGEVINSHDQYEVFNDPRASDPTHSFLSKDHFNLILNEPAGRVARVVVKNAVGHIQKAWDDNSVNVHSLTEEVLQAMFHPNFHNPNSKVQREMLQEMNNWVNDLGKKKERIIRRLTKEAVRNHENVRLAGEGGAPVSQGSFAQAEGSEFQNTLLGYANQIPGVSQATQLFDAAGGGKKYKKDKYKHGHGHGHGREVGGDGYDDGVSSRPVDGHAALYYHHHDGDGDGDGDNGPKGDYGSYSYYAPSFEPSLNSGYAPAGSGYVPPQGTYASPGFPGDSGSGYRPLYDSSVPAPAAAAVQHAGYAPSYASPSFPGAAPSFPGAAPSSFTGGAPPFPPDSSSYPGQQPPRFPEGAPLGFPGEQYSQRYEQPPPQFPGARTYGSGGW
ncbi:hypothetical protein H2248_012481 [Termitomyces sp. 'cryptogamus']|nr:hypothetical protein H2248_012481 [Termitomyces sp. 'cryptogamus']